MSFFWLRLDDLVLKKQGKSLPESTHRKLVSESLFPCLCFCRCGRRATVKSRGALVGETCGSFHALLFPQLKLEWRV